MQKVITSSYWDFERWAKLPEKRIDKLHRFV